MPHSFAIAIIGAESTGKSTLAQQLQLCFLGAGFNVVLQTELLRSWCDNNKKTPQQQEQKLILDLQINSQNEWHKAIQKQPSLTTPFIYISDTAALQTAAYSHYYFKDPSLDTTAQEAHRFFNFTLLMGLDLPWQDDSLRTGRESQKPVDNHLRQLLQESRFELPFSTTYGKDQQRLGNAWLALQKQTVLKGLLPDLQQLHMQIQLQTQLPVPPSAQSAKALANFNSNITSRNLNHLENGMKRWGHFCENCADGDCEKKLFQNLKSPS